MSFSISLPAGAIVAVLGLLASLSAAYFIQQRIIIPRIKREFMDLNAKRAERVRLALASTSVLSWDAVPQVPKYPFTGWVELLPDGGLKIAGETFPFGSAIEAVARDESNNIPRARVTGGFGNVVIHSHGNTYKASYRDGAWNIELVNLAST